MALPLNFPVFYYCAVKGNTNLPQYDAVSILLLGKPRRHCSGIVISDADATNYTSGRKNIKNEILMDLLDIEKSEVGKRIQALGIQDTASIAKALRQLLITEIDLSKKILDRLLHTYKQEDTDFISEVFLLAIKSPAKNLFPLSKANKDTISLCYFDNSSITASVASTVAEMSSETKDAFDEESPVNPSKVSIKPGTESYNGRLYMSDINVSAFHEVCNIIGSSGITVFSNFLDIPLYAGFPNFNFYESVDLIADNVFKPNFTNVFHNFWTTNGLSGCIIVSMENAFLRDFYIQHVRECSLHLSSAKEIEKYKMSMYSEFGSQFSSAAVTALADMINLLVKIKETDFSTLSNLLGNSLPIFVGSLPFGDKNLDFNSHLLLNYQAVRSLVDYFFS